MAATPTTSRFRWIVCALLFFATTINYVDRQVLSLIKELLDEELGWSATEFGIVNSAFQGAYGVSLLGFGWLVDRIGTRPGYAISIVAWSLAAMAHAAVGSVSGFLSARIALGLGEGGNFPTAIKAVAQWFPKGERALATSLFNSGTNVGAVLAPAIVPAIALNWGWQSAFVLAGIAGFVWLAFWWWLYSEPRESSRVSPAELALIEADSPASSGAAKISWAQLLRYRQTWSFITAKFLTDPVWWFFLIWLPDFFKKVYGLDIRQSWDKLVAIYAIVTVLSIAGGWITGHLYGRGWTITRARKCGMLLFAICVVPVVAATRVDVWPAVLLIALAGSAHQAWSATLFTTVSDLFPQRAVASVTGIGGFAGAIGGMLFPIVCGLTLDHYRAAGDEAAAYTVLLTFCAFAYLVTFAIHHVLVPRLDPVRAVNHD